MTVGLQMALGLVGLLSGWAFAEPNLAAAGARSVLTESQAQWLADHPNLRIGFTAIPPQVFYDAQTGAMSGLCIDYLRAVEEQLGYRFELVFYPTWDEMMKAAFQGKIDVIYAAKKTPVR